MAKCLKLEAYIWGEDSVTVVINSREFTINSSHGSYQKVIDELKSEEPNPDRIKSLMSLKTAIKQFSNNTVTVNGSAVMYRGQELHGVLVEQILRLYNEGLQFSRFVKFLDNLMVNPSKRAVDELYKFLVYVRLPITEDGCFLGYKKVQENYMDYYSNSVDNTPGTYIPPMPRNQVDDEKERTCSYGYHVGSFTYANEHYHAGQGRLILVRVNPADVVSVPVDYEGQKLRCCWYEVVSDYCGE